MQGLQIGSQEEALCSIIEWVWRDDVYSENPLLKSGEKKGFEVLLCGYACGKRIIRG